MNTIRLYRKSMAMLIRSHLQYPASFLMQTLAQLVMEGGEMMAVILLVDRFDHMNQWTGGNLYFFFGLTAVIPLEIDVPVAPDFHFHRLG